MRPPGAAVSKATLGKVRRMLVERLTPEALNPFARTPENEALVRSTLAAICAEPELDLAINPVLIAEIEAAICGLGPLQPLVDDAEVADILVNAPDSVFVERAGRLQPTEVRLADARELIELAERIAALAGRELSVAHPVVDARMPDGSRVNAVIPPVGGPYLSIRKFNRLRLDLVPGGPHPELFAAAAEGARHRWVRADFEELLSRYYANEPPKDALAVIRRRQAGRNLALLYDALYVLTATGQPAVAASEVLAELGEATRSNQSIARQAAAESRGLRIQALVLAVVIPLLFLYLLLVNPELVAPVTDTALGRFVLLPGAALLEVTGIWLSLRVARLEA